MISVESLEEGAVVASREMRFTRDTLVRYAGASGDFNPIHYRDDVAAEVGLPGVLAHGMLTMGAANSVVTDWLDDSGFVVDTQARFTKPVIVDPSDGADLTVTATVGSIDADAKRARIDLRVVFGEVTVLGRAQVIVEFSR